MTPHVQPIMVSEAAAAERKLKVGKQRMRFWANAMDALAEQKEVRQPRIQRADVDDWMLPADIQTWCELSGALTSYLRAGRAA